MKGEQRVYFIKPVGMDGPIKIGCSEKPMSRLLSISQWSPFALELIGAVSGGFDEERMLHRRFSELHTRGEWFMSSPRLRQTIELILSGTSIAAACASLEDKGPIRNQKKPARTPDRELFRKYGQRIRKIRPLWEKGGHWEKPKDISDIMHNWRCNRAQGHAPVIPTADQIKRLEEYISDPKKHSIFVHRPPPRPKDPICIPVVVEDADGNMTHSLSPASSPGETAAPDSLTTDLPGKDLAPPNNSGVAA